MLLAVVKGEL